MAFKPDDQGICDCCQYGDVPLQHHQVPEAYRAKFGDDVLLCEVCYMSMAGTWYIYSDVHDPAQVELGRLIAWGINYLKVRP
jgi:hypothetical protein